MLFLFALGQQVGALEGGTECQIQQDDADRGGDAVDEGDAAGDLGQSLGDGVFLTKNVHVAEIAEKRVGEDIQQQAGGTRSGDLEQVAGAAAVKIAELEDLVGDGTAGDADENRESGIISGR